MSDAAPAAAADTVVLSKADHATLMRAWNLLSKVYDDTEHGATVRKALKKADPTVRIPEIDVAEPLLAPIRDELTATREELKAIKEQQAKDAEERQTQTAVTDLSAKLAAAQKKHRLTAEGMEEVKKIMIERGVNDPEIAARYVVSEIEPSKPMTGSNFAPAKMDVLGMGGKSEEDSIKQLHADPVKWLDDAVPAILEEFEQDKAA